MKKVQQGDGKINGPWENKWEMGRNQRMVVASCFKFRGVSFEQICTLQKSNGTYYGLGSKSALTTFSTIGLESMSLLNTINTGLKALHI